MEAKSEEELFASILKWVPYVSFDATPVITVDQTLEQIMKLGAG
jgi:hypothetical protein